MNKQCTLCPEEHLVILLARQLLTENDVIKFNELCALNINWAYFYYLLQLNNISPFLFYHVANNKKRIASSPIPQDIIDLSRRSYSSSLEFITRVSHELERLSHLFNKYGIKCIVFKGLSYLHNVYTVSNFRSFSDIDLLFKPQDIMKANEILLNNGFDYYNGTEKSTAYSPNTKEYLWHLHRFTHKNLDYIIEMHQVVTHSFIPFSRYYDDAELFNKHYYILSTSDLFIHACIHAWQHYSIFFEHLIKGYALTLKLLMDIRESYLILENKGLLSMVYNTINELHCNDITGTMLKLTERIYGDFCNFDELKKMNNSLEVDLKIGNNISSLFEKRLLDPIKEYNTIQSFFTNNNIVECYRVKNDENISSQLGTKYLLDTTKPITNIFDDHVYWKSTLNERPLRSNCVLLYNDMSLHVVLSIELLDKIYFYNEELYEYALKIKKRTYSWQNSVELSFGAHLNEEPYLFVVHPSRDNNHKIYNVTHNQFLPQNVFSIHASDNTYDIQIRLPWNTLSFSPDKQSRFFFDISINLSDKINRQKVCWFGGRFARFDNCSTHAEVILIKERSDSQH